LEKASEVQSAWKGKLGQSTSYEHHCYILSLQGLYEKESYLKQVQC